jgi:cytochrome c-type biogenesis protein CcmH
MIIFWLVCAIFVAIALAFVLPPLLQGSGTKEDSGGQKEANIAVYRDQLSELEADLNTGIVSKEQFDQDRDEIERRLLEDVTLSGPSSPKPLKPAKEARGVVYVIALGIPILAVALYLRIGNPYAAPTQATPSAPAMSPTASGDVTQPRIEANVASLAKRLEQNPDDVDGWKMLARSYVSLEKYGEASNAYAKASALKPDDADLMADYAFSLAMASERKLQGKPAELVRRALELDPENPKALELAGNVAFEAKDYQRAIAYWQKLVGRVPANSEVAESLNERINDAKARAESGGAK